jgi:hypothetical protein
MSLIAPPKTILDLPPEIVVKIVNKLPYADLKSVRLTCWAFNEAGMYVQRTALHKMRSKADLALQKCHMGFQNISETQALRALKGTASVKCLSGIIRIADASTFYFIMDGVVPPVPAGLLVDVDKALWIALKKNPLVGRERLKKIFSSFNKYLTVAMNLLHCQLKPASVFRSATDLMVSLPFKTFKITRTSFGLHCFIYLNLLPVVTDRDGWVLTAPHLIHQLAKLNVKGIQEHISVNMCQQCQHLCSEENPAVEEKIDLIELVVVCRPEESEGVSTLMQVSRMDPKEFKVRLHGVSVIRPSGKRYSQTNFHGGPPYEAEEQVSSWIYCSQPPIYGLNSPHTSTV